MLKYIIVILFFISQNCYSQKGREKGGYTPKQNNSSNQRSQGLKQREHFVKSKRKSNKNLTTNGTGFRHKTTYWRIKKEGNGFNQIPNFYFGRNKKKGLY